MSHNFSKVSLMSLTVLVMIMKLGELKLGELLDTPPPGLDEAIAISKVILILSVLIFLSLAHC